MSLKLGKYIDAILTAQSDTWMRQKVGMRVFPVVCPAEVPALPYVVHNEGVDSVEQTCDGESGDVCSALIDVVCSDYSTLIDIAQNIREKFTSAPTWSTTGLSVDSCRLIRVGLVQYIEDMDAFSLQMNFTITTIN